MKQRRDRLSRLTDFFPVACLGVNVTSRCRLFQIGMPQKLAITKLISDNCMKQEANVVVACNAKRSIFETSTQYRFVDNLGKETFVRRGN